MKTTGAVLLLVLVLVLPLFPAGAQEEAADGPAVIAPQANINSTISGLINKVVGFLAPIGALFGSVAGFRIGGTTGTGIAALVVAKVIEDKAPSWVRYLLYAAGGTMFAGGGANIAQAIMGQLQ